jgi:hypothetical protein
VYAFFNQGLINSAQIFTDDTFHGHVHRFADFAELKDRTDVGMTQARRGFCFLYKGTDEFLIPRHVGQNPFDSGKPFESRFAVRDASIDRGGRADTYSV